MTQFNANKCGGVSYKTIGSYLFASNRTLRGQKRILHRGRVQNERDNIGDQRDCCNENFRAQQRQAKNQLHKKSCRVS